MAEHRFEAPAVLVLPIAIGTASSTIKNQVMLFRVMK